MSLRERVYSAIVTTYHAGEKINPYIIADKCGTVNAVLHTIYSLADEGIIGRRFSAECPHCNAVNPLIVKTAKGYQCGQCGNTIHIDSESDFEAFDYFVPDETRLQGRS